jgi:hypothetical protein
MARLERRGTSGAIMILTFAFQDRQELCQLQRRPVARAGRRLLVDRLRRDEPTIQQSLRARPLPSGPRVTGQAFPRATTRRTTRRSSAWSTAVRTKETESVIPANVRSKQRHAAQRGNSWGQVRGDMFRDIGRPATAGPWVSLEAPMPGSIAGKRCSGDGQTEEVLR